MTDELDLDDREKFIIGLMLANGGIITYEKLVNIALKIKGPFYHLSKNYVKYKAVETTINRLLNKSFIDDIEKNEYSLSGFIKQKYIELYPKKFLDSLSAFSKYRHQYHLEFDMVEIEESILDPKWEDIIPYEIVEQIKQAIEIYNKTDSYDAVILKCGKVMEILINKVNKEYNLVRVNKRESIGLIIKKFMEEGTIKKFKSSKEREGFRVFSYSAYLIYKYRSKMGAHHTDWGWGMKEISVSCLLLTCYLVDLISTDFYM